MVTGWKTATVKETSTIFGRIGFRGYTKEDIVDAYEGAISLSPSNLKDGKVDITNSTFISWDKYNESPEIKLQDGDVVLVKTGSTYGKSAYVDNLKWATTLNPQIVVFKNIRINKKLFAYFVQTPEFQKQIEATIVGGAIPTLSQNQVYQFEITFPIDVGEQNRIAEALSDVDDMISSLEKLIAKKKAVKQGAMQELLTGKKRLPGFTREWRECKLKDVLTVGHGQSQHKIEDVNGKYPILATGGIIGRTNSLLYDQPSVLIGRKGTIDKPQYMDTPFWTIDTLFYTKINANNNAKYIFYVFCLIDWLDYNEASGVPSLSASVIEEIEVLMPTLEEQTAIASILSNMDNEIEALEQKLAKTRQIKQGMMQQLLTGKIRLV